MAAFRIRPEDVTMCWDARLFWFGQNDCAPSDWPGALSSKKPAGQTAGGGGCPTWKRSSPVTRLGSCKVLAVAGVAGDSLPLLPSPSVPSVLPLVVSKARCNLCRLLQKRTRYRDFPPREGQTTQCLDFPISQSLPHNYQSWKNLGVDGSSRPRVVWLLSLPASTQQLAKLLARRCQPA